MKNVRSNAAPKTKSSAPQKVARPRHWVVLLISAALEAVWAIALDESEGFTQLMPSVVFLIAMSIGMVLLAYALRGLPVSIAYAIWTGIGSALTVSVAMLTGAEAFSVLKVLFITGIVGCVIALKFTPDPPEKSVALQRAATS